MLKKNAIKRILTSTLALGIMFLLCLFPQNSQNKITKELVYVDEITIPIYAIDHNNYVSRTNLIKSDDDQIAYIIDALTKNSKTSNYLQPGFTPIIPEKTKLVDYNIENNILSLNFSKEFLNIKKENENQLLESLIYSLTELENIDKISIYVENENLLKMPSGQIIDKYLDKSFGINKSYNFNNIKSLTKTTIYYIGKYEDNTYYIPITKITNDTIEPVEIIVKELKTTPIYETNLISYLNASYELKDYEILEDSINLSFNNKMIANLDDQDINEKVKYTLSLSLRDTYNISDITININ